jgi:hypothetical protein
LSSPGNGTEGCASPSRHHRYSARPGVVSPSRESRHDGDLRRLGLWKLRASSADNRLTMRSGSGYSGVAPSCEISGKNEGQRLPAAPNCPRVLLWEQRVGGSNPSAPTTFPSVLARLKICDRGAEGRGFESLADRASADNWLTIGSVPSLVVPYFVIRSERLLHADLRLAT